MFRIFLGGRGGTKHPGHLDTIAFLTVSKSLYLLVASNFPTSPQCITFFVLAGDSVGCVAGDGGFHLLGVDHHHRDVEVVLGHQRQVRIHILTKLCGTRS